MEMHIYYHMNSKAGFNCDVVLVLHSGLDCQWKFEMKMCVVRLQLMRIVRTLLEIRYII